MVFIFGQQTNSDVKYTECTAVMTDGTQGISRVIYPGQPVVASTTVLCHSAGDQQAVALANGRKVPRAISCSGGESKVAHELFRGRESVHFFVKVNTSRKVVI